MAHIHDTLPVVSVIILCSDATFYQPRILAASLACSMLMWKSAPAALFAESPTAATFPPMTPTAAMRSPAASRPQWVSGKKVFHYSFTKNTHRCRESRTAEHYFHHAARWIKYSSIAIATPRRRKRVIFIFDIYNNALCCHNSRVLRSVEYLRNISKPFFCVLICTREEFIVCGDARLWMRKAIVTSLSLRAAWPVRIFCMWLYHCLKLVANNKAAWSAVAVETLFKKLRIERDDVLFSMRHRHLWAQTVLERLV